MKVFVVDKFLERRDPAMTDMYSAMAKKYSISSGDILTNPLSQNYDILWLGIYHHRMGIDINQLRYLNTKPIIIDQADNEEFLGEINLYKGLQNVTVLSRYLPHIKLERKCAELGFAVKLLPWYVNPARMPQNKKTCDVAYICSMYGDRLITKSLLEELVKDKGKTSCIGEYWGAEYYELLSKCRMSVVECSRHCLTQKYIEGALAKSFLLGDIPYYPHNELKVLGVDLLHKGEITQAIGRYPDEKTIEDNRQYVLDTFANEGWFMKHLSMVL